MSEESINSFEDVMKEISFLLNNTLNDESLIFRGHSNKKYTLIPGIFRVQNYNEYLFTHQLEIEYSEEFNRHEHFSTLTKMQHYGLNTRLLDFSFNPLISLYIACLPTYNDIGLEINNDGELIILKVKKEEIKHHYSDTILCLSCLPFLKEDDKENIKKYCLNNKNSILNDNSFRDNKSIHHLYHEIRGEYPTFEYEIKSNDLLTSFFVSPNKDNERLRIQNGLFAIYGLDKDISKSNVEKHIVERIVIPNKCKSKILKMLNLMNINESIIYPSLERSAIDLYGKYFVKRKIRKE